MGARVTVLLYKESKSKKKTKKKTFFGWGVAGVSDFFYEKSKHFN